MDNQQDPKTEFKKGFFSKWPRYSGIFLAGIFSSLIAYAAITLPHTFSSGTTISSTEVNANFQTVVDQVNKTPYGFVASLSGDQTIPNGTSNNVVQLDTVVRSNVGAAFNAGTYTFTVPPGEGGFYGLYVIWRTTTGCCSWMGEIRYRVNGGTTVYYANLQTTLASENKSVFLNDGDTLDFVFNETKGKAVDPVIEAATFNIAVVRVI